MNARAIPKATPVHSKRAPYCQCQWPASNVEAKGEDQKPGHLFVGVFMPSLPNTSVKLSASSVAPGAVETVLTLAAREGACLTQNSLRMLSLTCPFRLWQFPHRDK